MVIIYFNYALSNIPQSSAKAVIKKRKDQSLSRALIEFVIKSNCSNLLDKALEPMLFQLSFFLKY